MIWLSPLTSLTDWPSKVKLVPTLIKPALAMAINPLTGIQVEVRLSASILPVNTPCASSLHLSVHVEPARVPTLMVLVDCMRVDTYKMPVLMEPKLAALVQL